MVDAVNEKTGKDFRNISLDIAVSVAKEHKIKLATFTIGHIINALYEELVEHELIEPTFVYGHPNLARRLRKVMIQDLLNVFNYS